MVIEQDRPVPWRPFEIGTRPWVGNQIAPANWIVDRCILEGSRALIAHYPVYLPEVGQRTSVQFVGYEDGVFAGHIYTRLDALFLLARNPEQLVEHRAGGSQSDWCYHRLTPLPDGRLLLEYWRYHGWNASSLAISQKEWAYMLREIREIPKQGGAASQFQGLQVQRPDQFPAHFFPGGCWECESGPGTCTCEKPVANAPAMTLDRYGRRTDGRIALCPFQRPEGTLISGELLLSKDPLILAQASDLIAFQGVEPQWWDRIIHLQVVSACRVQYESWLPVHVLKTIVEQHRAIAPETPGRMHLPGLRLRWGERGVIVQTAHTPAGAEPSWQADRFSWTVWLQLIGALPDFIAWEKASRQEHQ